MEELSPSLLGWLSAEPRATGTVLDVGTGGGRLAFALARRARRVVGIDLDAGQLLEARRRARRGRITNILFVVADAETADYRALGGAPDVVAAHLCVSEGIVRQAAAGLSPGGVLALAAFHVDQWRETARVSRFAYDETRVRRELEAHGFTIGALVIERRVLEFASAEAAMRHAEDLRGKWESSGRWEGWLRHVAAGGRTLTESRLAVFARRLP